MDAAAPWENDPIVQPAADPAPWLKDPVVTPAPAPAPAATAPAVVSQDGPVVTPAPAPAPAATAPAVVSQDGPAVASAPGLNLNVNGVSASPAPVAPPAAPPAPAPPAPTQQPFDGGRTEQLGVQALDKGAVADTLGMPVDLATAAANAGSMGANVIGHILGNPNDVTPYIHNPVGGSQSISDAAGEVYHALTGNTVASPATMSPSEAANYRTAEMGANAATTEGLGAIFSKVMGLVRAADAAPATTGVQVYRDAAPEAAGPTLPSMASAGVAGVGAGTVQNAYEQHASPLVKGLPYVGPTLDAVLDAASGYGGALGGTLASAAARTGAKVASIPARAAVRMAFPDASRTAQTLQDGRIASPADLDAAAAIAQRAAIDPKQAAANIADTTNTLRAEGPITPTTGAMSADPGLIGLEQKLRPDPEIKPAFIQNDRQVQQAAVNAANKIAPETAVGRTFTDTANQMQADKVATARSAVDDAENQIGALDTQRQADANPVLAAKNTQVPASQALDDTIVNKTLMPMQAKNSAMYAAVDPDKSAVVSADPLLDAASAVKNSLGDFNSPEKVIPKGLLARINATKPDNSLDPEVEAAVSQMSPKAQAQVRAQLQGPDEPATTSIGDIVSVYPELAATEQRARRAGNFNLADNIKTLRNSMDDVIGNAADSGDSAAQAALDAKQNYSDTIGKTFNDGPGGPATQFRKNFNLDRFGRSTTPPSQTAGEFLQAGQPEKAQSLKAIVDKSENPADGQKAVGQYLMADLANSGAVKNGVIDPQAVANWRAKWGEDTLATAPAFKSQLDQMQASATAGKDQASQLGQQLKARQADLNGAEQNDTAFQHVVGSSPTKAVAGIMQSKDPENAMKDIVAGVGAGTAAHDGLKAAFREYLMDRATTSALQKTTTGDNPLSFAKLDNLFKENEGTMSQVFSPDEMSHLQAAHTFLASLNNLNQQSLAGSATAERNVAASDKLWKIAEIGLKARYGGLEGGNKIRNIKLAAALQGGGPNTVSHMLGEMQFNPELAEAVLTRNVKKPTASGYNAKIFTALTLPASIARDNDSQPSN